MEIIATYSIIIAVFVVVIFVVRNDCVARNCSISAPFAFILKCTVPPSLLCRECSDQTAKSKVHRERACRFQMQYISASTGVVVRSLCRLIVVLFLFHPSSPVRIFKSIVHPLFDVSSMSVVKGNIQQACRFEMQYAIAFAGWSDLRSSLAIWPRGASHIFSNFGCPFLECLEIVLAKFETRE